MVAMRMQESRFGAPEGVYVARFLGLSPMKDDGTPRLGRDGRPMEPGVEWQFNIEEGPHKGKIVGRITSQVPTAGNACGRLLQGVAGRKLGPDDEVDPSAFVGRLYQVVVKPSTTNPERTQVDMVLPHQGGAPAPSAPKPPPRPGQAPAPAPAPKFWVDTGEDNPALMTQKELQDWVKAGQKDPAQVQVCQEGGDQWKYAAEVGVLSDIPF